LLSPANNRSVVAVFAVAVFAVAVLTSCGGLDPGDLPPETAITGSVVFEGGSAAWPDSNVYEVRVAAFEQIPTAPDSVFNAIISQTAIISDTLPRYSASAGYRILVPAPPRTFRYIVVAMRNGTDFLKDWLMLSVYAPSGDPAQPGTITVNPGSTTPINFNVDFNNLPPQPFE
jgi:hypothetical protein